jgi:hypothetical protein
MILHRCPQCTSTECPPFLCRFSGIQNGPSKEPPAPDGQGPRFDSLDLEAANRKADKAHQQREAA